MPRQRRRWEPGDILSIVVRAHEGRPIFATDEDRRFFVARLKRVFVAPDVDLIVWALPINHFHLVIRVRDAAPGTLFLRLNTAIAQRERRLRGDHGAVLQDRYWSKRCEGDGLLRLLTYVLGNPAHHGAVETAAALESYPWTAYPEVLGLASPGIVDPGAVLALVHPDPEVARSVLREAMAARVAEWRAQRAGIDVCDEPGCLGAADGCLLAHRERRRRASAAALAEPDRPATTSTVAGISRAHDERRERQARLLAAGWSVLDLLPPLCVRLRADPAAVRRGGRLHAECRARAIAVHVACDGVGLSVRHVAPLLGINEPSASAARARGRAFLAAAGWGIDDVLAWT